MSMINSIILEGSAEAAASEFRDDDGSTYCDFFVISDKGRFHAMARGKLAESILAYMEAGRGLRLCGCIIEHEGRVSIKIDALEYKPRQVIT